MALNNQIRIAGIEALENAELLNNSRRFRMHDDGFDESEENFIKLYRLTKNVASDLIDTLSPHIRFPSRTSALDIERKVSCYLSFH